MTRDELLSDLLDVLLRLAGGDLAARVSLPEPSVEDDLAAVAVGVNMLAEELETLTHGLEAAVTQRTEELQAVHAQLVYDAGHDHLTGLANRRLLQDRIDNHIRRRVTDSFLLLLDLDGFKDVNDSLGHGMGDAVLVATADALRTCLRPGDTVARLGGDEFAALLTGVTSEESSVVAARVLDQISTPAFIEGHTVTVTASAGLVSLDAASGADELLQFADVAMYRAKAEGKNRVVRYTGQVHEQAQRRRDIERGLRTVLTSGALAVAYQPIVHSRSLELLSVEALARWPNGEGPVFGPEAFIPVAEQSGQIQDLGAAVLRQVCRDAVLWAERTGSPLRFAVNVSNAQLSDPNFADVVFATLSVAGATPEMLSLEVTETVLMDRKAGLAGLGQLRDAGVHIAVDDFGSGYSSLFALRRLPVTMLKIDRTFTADLERDDHDAKVVRSVLALAKGLELSVVAEGVETPEQHEQLLSLGCEAVQGYLHARPMPFDELMAWAGRRRSEGRS